MSLQNDLFIPQQRSEIRQEFVGRSQGAEANHKGRELEKQVRELFVSRGAIMVSHEKFSRKTADFFDSRMLIPQFPYTAVMNQRARCDLVYWHGASGARVGIECKVQDDTGSADEKLFVLYHNSLRWDFVDHAWFVLSGEGFRKKFIEWLCHRAHVEYPTTKITRVFTSIEQVRKAVRALVERGDAMGGQ